MKIDGAQESVDTRKLFQEGLRELCRSNVFKGKLALLYLHVEHLDYINITMGHSIGDQLLAEVFTRLQSCIDKHNLLFGTGADEFAVIVSNLQNNDQLTILTKKILSCLEAPYTINTEQLRIHVSIGISIYPTDAQDSATLLRNANIALLRAKEKRKSYHIYTASLDAEIYTTYSLGLDLLKALEFNQLELYYQPLVQLPTFQLLGAEALIRWNHPAWGLISSAQIISLSDDMGLTVEINRWITNTVCAQIKAWQRAGLPVKAVSINFSAQEFSDKSLLENMREALQNTNLDPHYLILEITETSLLEEDGIVINTLEKLRRMGIRIALDDFGTGYSSLSTLMTFKDWLDFIKIDQSFIRNLCLSDSSDANYFSKTMVQLAEHCHLNVVAEGVEKKEQLSILQKYNCRIVQGYLFSKPIPAQAFSELLKQGKLEIKI